MYSWGESYPKSFARARFAEINLPSGVVWKMPSTAFSKMERYLASLACSAFPVCLWSDADCSSSWILCFRRDISLMSSGCVLEGSFIWTSCGQR
ncbi:MAG: hypothetical protein C0399_12115 [Syntrophus sp. (in: bacteria)]|nr:hypothetical protein [Syntrophus sp. (in: bacteria)]